MKKQQKFDEIVRDLEKQEFPEFAKENIYAPPQNGNFYFGPSWHFKSGLLTKKLVTDIREKGRKILSVGSGEAYLERLLVKNFGVKREQITLSDKVPVMPEDFEKITFDMYEKWPDFGKKFDYVIFPESVLLNVRFNGNPQKSLGLYHILKESLATMESTGQIRINGHSQLEENIDNVNRWLEQSHPNSKLTSNNRLITIKKGYKR